MQFTSDEKAVLGIGPFHGGHFPMRISPSNKAKRGVTLNWKERSEFAAICGLYPEHIIECYKEWEGEYSAHDFSCACQGCPHCLIKGSPYNSNSIFRPYFVTEVWADAVDETDGPYKDYVYLISDGEYIKIGKAKDPKKRLLELQTGNARELKILYLIPTVETKGAITLETRLHRTYSDYRMCGEWFNIMDKLIHDDWERIYGASQTITGKYKPNLKIAGGDVL